jgi:L-fuconolactonase
MNPVIDAHHHFWKYSPAEYGWIGKGLEVLARDYLPPDLKAEISQAGIDGVISVQARQTVAETDWLLELAEENGFIRGVVGWGPLVDVSSLRKHLDVWTRNPKLVALRHVLQDEPDDRHMLRPDFDAGVSILKEYNLRYDILIFERQLPGAMQLVDRHPNQIFILDHIAKPSMIGGDFQSWRGQILELARRENVCCKISGMATEADWKTWTPVQLRPYFEAVLEAFGPARLMFGSDWPVCLLATGYGRWATTVHQWTEKLSADEKGRIWGGTAMEAYFG